jgi:hypothetical protein
LFFVRKKPYGWAVLVGLVDLPMVILWASEILHQLMLPRLNSQPKAVGELGEFLGQIFWKTNGSLPG